MVKGELGSGDVVFVRLAGRLEQGDEGVQPFRAEVAELAGAAVADDVPHPREQTGSGGRQAHLHDPPVVSLTDALHEPAGLEPVEQPRDVGRPRHEPAGE